MTLSPKPGKALTQAAVVDAIRQGILNGDLVPGQRLVEAELCESLGASRGNVRTALVDLDHEGLVERITNRGARVRLIGLPEALQIAEVRLEVEGLCVAKAAERITDGEIRELRDFARRLRDHRAHTEAREFADLVHQIFETYVRIADQPVAEEVLRRLRARNTSHRFRLIYQPGRSQVAGPYWLTLVDAICSRNPDAARQALRRLAQNVQEAMKALAQKRMPLAAPSAEATAQQDAPLAMQQ